MRADLHFTDWRSEAQRTPGQSLLLSQPLWGLLHPRKKGYGTWVTPSQKEHKHKGTPVTHRLLFLYWGAGGGDIHTQKA